MELKQFSCLRRWSQTYGSKTMNMASRLCLSGALVLGSQVAKAELLEFQFEGSVRHVFTLGGSQTSPAQDAFAAGDRFIFVVLYETSTVGVPFGSQATRYEDAIDLVHFQYVDGVSGDALGGNVTVTNDQAIGSNVIDSISGESFSDNCDCLEPLTIGDAELINVSFSLQNSDNTRLTDQSLVSLELLIPWTGSRFETIWMRPDGTITYVQGRLDTFIPPQTDADGDGILDISDNCIDVPNFDQSDNDGDLAGDACDVDDDNDGVEDESDNCLFVANAGQSDLDGDGLGAACDSDPDGDGIAASDNCPFDPNPFQSDSDFDGAGDECDADDDNDSILDEQDNCEFVINPDQEDLDSDGIGDACDVDIDGDGVVNEVDNCLLIANFNQDDTDADGHGDECDFDDDGDGIEDGIDNCPLISNPAQVDSDGDGGGDACDGDLDGDGVANDLDNCPSIANSAQYDFDADGLGDACDPDVDADNVVNSSDLCPLTDLSELADPATGCSLDQLCPCTGPIGMDIPWRNHGKYVSCVAQTTNSFADLGLIGQVEKDNFVSAAGFSECGK